MTEQATLTLTEFLEARIAEDEAAAQPRTVIVSGGSPAAEVPNCVGPNRTGGCGWRLDGEGRQSGWWRAPRIKEEMRAHEWTHATRQQVRAVAECGAKRAVLEIYETMYHDHDGNMYRVLRALALPYADHPDYRQEWRP